MQSSHHNPHSSNNRDNRHNSAGKPNNDRRPSRSQDRQPFNRNQPPPVQRYQSKTPPSSRSTSHVSRQPRPQQTDRGRQPSGGHNARSMSRGSRASAYSTSRSGGRSGSNDSQYSAVQKHSSYSKSSRKHETVPIPTIYRSKSPGTVASLKKHYFVPGPGQEVFANWKSLGNCFVLPRTF